MKFLLAKDEPFTFLHDLRLNTFKGKWGQFTMRYQVNEGDLDECDKRISDVFRKMVDRYPPNATSTSCNMTMALVVKEEPKRMCQGRLLFCRPEEAFLKNIAALYHEGNVRVKVTLSFPPSQTSNTVIGTDNPAEVTYNCLSTKEMVVNSETPKRSSAVGSVLFSNAEVPARFLAADSSINAFFTVEVMLDTEYMRLPTKSKNDSPEEKMFHDQINFDLTITAGSGRQIKCHKSVLSACSPVFRAMLAMDMVEAKTHNVDISEMSETGVKSFLDYIYCLNQDVPTENCEIALELLNAAHKYNVTPDLETAMTTLILSKPSASDWFNVDVAVNIFLFAENITKYKEALKQKAIQILKERDSTTLRNSETYVEMFQKHPAEAMELCELLFGRLSGKPVDIKLCRSE